MPASLPSIGPHPQPPLVLSAAALAVTASPGDAPAGAAWVLGITLLVLAAVLWAARARAPRTSGASGGRDVERLGRIEREAAVGSLAARVAHDVRNPLFAISATLDAFEARCGSQPESGRYVAALRDQCARLERLMKDLVGRAAPQPPHFAPVAPSALAAEAVRACRPAGTAAAVEIRNRVGGHLEPVTADREQMVVALRHLIENAIRRSPAGAPVEIVAREAGRNGGGVLELEIRDRGPAIPDPEMPRVFDPLFVPAAGESGLGMAVARRIVEGHRGEVSLRNASEGGAVAVLRLPVRDAGGGDGPRGARA